MKLVAAASDFIYLSRPPGPSLKQHWVGRWEQSVAPSGVLCSVGAQQGVVWVEPSTKLGLPAAALNGVGLLTLPPVLSCFIWQHSIIELIQHFKEGCKPNLVWFHILFQNAVFLKVRKWGGGRKILKIVLQNVAIP